MPDVPRPRPPYLHPERNRHGTLCWYVRRGHGRRIRLKAEYGTDEFWEEYRDALEGRTPAAKRQPKAQTVEWAIRRYMQSEAWAKLAPGTRRQRENVFSHVIAASGARPVAEITSKAIAKGMERRADRPHAANNFLKAMRGLVKWAMTAGLLAADPTAGVKKLAGRNDDGFHTWTEEEVARFEAHWPLGTRQRLALDIMLYTGFRRSDAVTFGRQDLRDGAIVKRVRKNRQLVTLPLLDPLRVSIDATRSGEVVFLITEAGQPFVVESFGNWFRKACQAAGVPGSAHGLRKVSATRSAENGATEGELMAMYGWADWKMARHYTRAADRRRMGLGAGSKMLRARSANE